MDQPGNPSEQPEAAKNGTSTEPPPADVREQEIELLRKKLDETVRAYAAKVNEHNEFRTRLQRERDRLIDLERGKVALAFLEAADELDRALKAAEGQSGPLVEGVRLTREAMGRKMAELGIAPLELAGKRFDPNVSEAVDLVAVDDPARDGQVVDEVLRGYVLGDKLLRAARVRVGKHSPAAPSPAPQPE